MKGKDKGKWQKGKSQEREKEARAAKKDSAPTRSGSTGSPGAQRAPGAFLYGLNPPPVTECLFCGAELGRVNGELMCSGCRARVGS